jgi:hypothetical protein
MVGRWPRALRSGGEQAPFRSFPRKRESRIFFFGLDPRLRGDERNRNPRYFPRVARQPVEVWLTPSMVLPFTRPM